MPKIAALGSLSSRGFGEFAQQTAANYIEDVFSTYLYTGNGSTQTITNGIDLAGTGGLVWTKSRSTTYNHQLYDTARGTTKAIFSNLTDAQLTLSTGLTAFNASGYTLGANGAVNDSTATYASWTFRKQPKFFDVVTYTGNGTAGRTVSHNLGSVPGMIIVKSTNLAENWAVYHRSNGNTKYMYLNTTAAAGTSSNFWNNTDPTSTTFTLGNDATVNDTGSTYVAYLFAHNAGGFGADGSQNVISCGSYAGNSSSNPINLGWEPQFILIKNITSVSSWYIQDTMRNMSLTNLQSLSPNTSSAEYNNSGPIVFPTATGFDFAAGGYTGWNQSGNNYIYMAIRRGPMRTPTSGTSVFSPVVYSGNNAARTINAGFTPDAVWFADRSATYWGQNTTIFDRLRGLVYSVSSGTIAESDLTPFVTAFGQSGINITISGMNNAANIANGYLDYFFGRAPGFFDEVCYTGTGSAATINHNLGVVPEMIIVKGRNGATDWPTYHTGLNGGVTPEQWYVRVNSTTAQTNAVANWNNTAPTSTVFSVGGNNIGSGTTFVAYLFATCPGVSKVGSYTGTGATQTISCGFTGGARFVLIKRADGVASWWVWDTARGMVAGTDPRLALNNTNAEANANWVYTTTGGFQIVTSDTAINASGGTYIYLAIA